MSGGDRGGVTDLIQTIHRSKVPIICICNDKYNQKLRSLRNHTLELDYRCESPLVHARLGADCTAMQTEHMFAHIQTVNRALLASVLIVSADQIQDET